MSEIKWPLRAGNVTSKVYDARGCVVCKGRNQRDAIEIVAAANRGHETMDLVSQGKTKDRVISQRMTDNETLTAERDALNKLLHETEVARDEWRENYNRLKEERDAMAAKLAAVGAAPFGYWVVVEKFDGRLYLSVRDCDYEKDFDDPSAAIAYLRELAEPKKVKWTGYDVYYEWANACQLGDPDQYDDPMDLEEYERVYPKHILASWDAEADRRNAEKGGE